jgi:hypothetical protein
MTAQRSRAGRQAEYRVARLQERLAESESAQLGIRAELHGESVLVTGVVPSSACRDQLLAQIAAELEGLDVHTDLVVVDAGPPSGAEEVR